MPGASPLPNRRRKANSGPSKALAEVPGDDPALRHTGIGFTGDMPWGDSYLPFLRPPQDLLDTAVCYFEAGLKSNEFCVWAVSDPISLQQAEQALRRAVPGFDHHRAAGQIELLAGREWYLRGDEFDLQRITGGWHEKLSSALARSYDGMRVSGNAFWLGTKTLEGVLRARTRSISRRSENRCKPAGPSTCLMWRVRINAPSCDGKAIGNF